MRPCKASFVGLLTLQAGARAFQGVAAPANVLLLMADQFRFDALNASFAPNLAQLAAQGLRLDSTYSSTPTCTPARSALLTGLSPWYHGMLGYGMVAPIYPNNPEMPRLTTQFGLRTAAIGKNHYWIDNTTGIPPSHGWGQQLLYDGIGDGFPNTTGTEEFDTYDQWFQQQMPGADPLATGAPLMDWNSWRGAPYVYPEHLHPTAWVGSLAQQWLRNYSAAASGSAGASEPPFFLKVSFHRPHSPYDPPQRMLDEVPAELLPPMRVGGNWDDAFSGKPGAPAGCGPSDPDAWCGQLSPEAEVTLGRRAYLANIRFVDEQVGHILGVLNATGLAGNTWILFVSDHGDGQGDHNLWRKGYPYEITAHVPGFIVWPPAAEAAVALPRGSATRLLGELRDVFPTVLDLAGVPLPPGKVLNGSSWACLVREDPSGARCGADGAGWRQYLDLEHSTVYNDTIHWNALTDGQTKYVFRAWFGDEQLFDLAADPYEYWDVSGRPEYNETLSLWRSRLVAQFQREGRGPSWVSADGRLMQRTQGTIYGPNFPGFGQLRG
jgi:arylsulfatase A-like enzyme